MEEKPEDPRCRKWEFVPSIPITGVAAGLWQVPSAVARYRVAQRRSLVIAQSVIFISK